MQGKGLGVTHFGQPVHKVIFAQDLWIYLLTYSRWYKVHKNMTFAKFLMDFELIKGLKFRNFLGKLNSDVRAHEQASYWNYYQSWKWTG